jgi:DNA-directed RNA polymerase specialized sigma24 family protein
MAKAKTPQLRFETSSPGWIYGVYREARRIAGTLCHDDDIADELTQNLIVEILKGKKQLPFITTWWLIARLRARLINHRKGERRRLVLFTREPEEGVERLEKPELYDNVAPSAEHLVWLGQLAIALQRAITSLPSEEMRAVMLLKMEEATDPQIAARLGLSENVALVRRLEAQQILQFHLRAYGDREPPQPKSLRRNGKVLRKGIEDAKSATR